MEQPNELEKQDKKKLNEDMVVFMRKRSAHDAPRYTARLKTYVDIQRKRRRADAARRNSEQSCNANDNKTSSPTAADRKKCDEQKDKEKEAADQAIDEDGEQIGRKSRRHVANSAELCNIVSNSSESVMLSSEPYDHHHHHHHDHDGDHRDCECERGWFGRRGAVEEKQVRGRSGSRTHSDDLSDPCCSRRRRRRRSCRRRPRRRRSCRRRRRSCRRRRRRRRSCRRRRRSCRRRRRGHRSCRPRRRRRH